MRSKMLTGILALCLLCLLIGTQAKVFAGEFYLHDNKQYWWYHVADPYFYVAVPNNAELYINKTMFGYEFLEISWDKGTIVMEIGVIPNAKTDDVINFVAKRWTPFLKNTSVFANREITTSNNLKTYFYGIEGTGPDGKKSMLRSVYFNNGQAVVYLAMFLPSSKYQGDMQNHWLKAVNEFEW
mgnify:CR=1 FL=1